MSVDKLRNSIALFASAQSKPSAAVDALGKPYYSYGFAMDGYLRALEQLDLQPTFIDNPRAVRDASWAQEFLADPEANPVHLMIQNFRSIRPLDWAFNIGIIAWEFDRLTGAESAPGNVFRDQQRMLKQCDEIWTLADYSTNVCRNHGFDNAYTIPSSIEQTLLSDELGLLSQPAVSLGGGFKAKGGGASTKDGRSIRTSERENIYAPLGLQPALNSDEGRPTVYVAVFNPFDHRKDPATLMHAFAEFSRQAKTPVALVVKLSVAPGRSDLRQLVENGKLPSDFLADMRGFACDNIVLMSASLSRAELTALYQRADFFVSSTRAEGQNLPLLEAMQCGTPAIAPFHTAMNDYLTPDVAIKIQSTVVKVPSAKPMNYHFSEGMHWYHSSVNDVFKALVSSSQLSNASYSAMAEQGKAKVASIYSAERVSKQIQKRLQEYIDNKKTGRRESR